MWLVLGPDGAFRPDSWDTSPAWNAGWIIVAVAGAAAGGFACVKVAADRNGVWMLVALLLVGGGAVAGVLRSRGGGSAPGGRRHDSGHGCRAHSHVARLAEPAAGRGGGLAGSADRTAGLIPGDSRHRHGMADTASAISPIEKNTKSVDGIGSTRAVAPQLPPADSRWRSIQALASPNRVRRNVVVVQALRRVQHVGPRQPQVRFEVGRAGTRSWRRRACRSRCPPRCRSHRTRRRASGSRRRCPRGARSTG